ncbi:MAG: rhodanese-related sulfurtransferase [Piscirickettsiaceae bacterium]|nr:rhodanese-related sulfurtransferase [Piscirickettsiaceae bacterium]
MVKKVVCALYKFVMLNNYIDLKPPLLDFMLEKNVRGTLLLAHEGINGTVSGSREDIDDLLQYLKNDKRLSTMSCKESFAYKIPFLRTRVKLKKEIVTMGVKDIDPTNIVETYVKPKNWNYLINNPDILLIDIRNYYEFQIGTFKNAINPDIKSFKEFPAYIKKNLSITKHKKVAIFCTGGIRCEKSTSYMKKLGFKEVYQLKGGILKYLEDVPAESTMWQGECFVFDERVTVNHNLDRGNYDQCNACRFPINEYDKQSEKYEYGISCSHCIDKISNKQKVRFRERRKQISLTKERMEVHMSTYEGLPQVQEFTY